MFKGEVVTGAKLFYIKRRTSPGQRKEIRLY